MTRFLPPRLQQPSRTLLRVALFGLLAGFALIVVRSYTSSFSGLADRYEVGEWLINYAGGFTRRGLGGSVIFGVADLFGAHPRAVLFGVVVCCYTVTFAALAGAAVRVRPLTLLDVFLIVSPFAALFPVFHQVAGQRKEVLLLALCALAYLTRLGRLDGVGKYAFWSVALGVLVAVHDGLIFFLPMVVLYLRVLTPADQPMGWRVLFLGAPAAVVFIVGYLYSSHADVQAICAAMYRHGNGDWCDANPAPGQFLFAASWLKASALDGLRTVAHLELRAELLTVGAGLVGLLPVAAALKADAPVLAAAVRDLPLGRWFLVAGIAPVVVLFAVANDWNRWFYIVTSVLTLVHFAARRRLERSVVVASAKDVAIALQEEAPSAHEVREPAC